MAGQVNAGDVARGEVEAIHEHHLPVVSDLERRAGIRQESLDVRLIRIPVPVFDLDHLARGVRRHRFELFPVAELGEQDGGSRPAFVLRAPLCDARVDGQRRSAFSA